MDLQPNDQQDAIVKATIDWLTRYMPLDHARARPSGCWRGMTEMGWLSMTTPETAGGLGLDHGSEVLVFAELGRFLAPIAALSSAVAGLWFGAEGRTALALVSGRRTRVLDANGAVTALAVTPKEARLVILPPNLEGAPGLDLTTSSIAIDPLPADRIVAGARVHLHLMLLAAAYGLGVADAARDMAAAYAAIRHQFGKSIGSFQGVKHPCADMAVRSAVSRSQLCYAACALDAGSPDAAFHIAAAKHLSDVAAMDNSRANIQVHGGIGMTDAALPHLLLKRAHLLQFVCPAETPMLLEPELHDA